MKFLFTQFCTTYFLILDQKNCFTKVDESAQNLGLDPFPDPVSHLDVVGVVGGAGGVANKESVWLVHLGLYLNLMLELRLKLVTNKTGWKG